MKLYTVLACVPAESASVFCRGCCPSPNTCETEHSAVFADQEWDYVPTCDRCQEPIEDVRIIGGAHDGVKQHGA